jgi:hypothetical protein
LIPLYTAGLAVPTRVVFHKALEGTIKIDTAQNAAAINTTNVRIGDETRFHTERSGIQQSTAAKA